MKSLINALAAEPVLTAALLAALVLAGKSFNLPVTDLQYDAISGVLFAAGAFFVRGRVTPWPLRSSAARKALARHAAATPVAPEPDVDPWPTPEPTPWDEDTTVVADERGFVMDGSVTR